MRRVFAAATLVLVSGCALPATDPGDDASPLAADRPVSAQLVGHDYAELGRMANVRLSMERYGGVVPEQLCRDAWRNLRLQPQWKALPAPPPTVFLDHCAQG
ncbi:MAG TPA: hypothetical protein VIM19_09580 [Actinomycetes bacterium]